MDRFIGVAKPLREQCFIDLKSNMDRFIAVRQRKLFQFRKI